MSATSANGEDDIMSVYYDGQLFSGGHWDTNIGFRPLVSLKSGVWLEEVSTGNYELHK